MKIMMVALSPSPHATRPLKWILELGYEVIYLSFSDPLKEKPKNYKFINLPRLKGKGYIEKVVGESCIGFIEKKIVCPKLKKIIREHNPELIHIHWINNRVAYFEKVAGDIPIILSVWGSDINNHFKRNACRRLRKNKGEILRDAKLVITDDPVIDRKCKILTDNKIKTVQLHLGIRPDLFNTVSKDIINRKKAELNISLNSKVFYSPRLWSDIYRQENILLAFVNAIKRANLKCILLFKYPSHDEFVNLKIYKRIMSLSTKFGIKDSIKWTPRVCMNDLPILYGLSDCIINYPTQDTLPILFLEAACCQCPVISSDLLSYRDTFAEKYFTLVDSDNQLEEEIYKFMVEENCYQKTKLVEAKKEVIKHFDEKLYINGINEIYEKY